MRAKPRDNRYESLPPRAAFSYPWRRGSRLAPGAVLTHPWGVVAAFAIHPRQNHSQPGSNIAEERQDG